MNFKGQSQFTSGQQKENAFEFTLCLVVVRGREEKGKEKGKEGESEEKEQRKCREN